jgi:general stress protein 26
MREQREKLWSEIEKMDACMLVTHDVGGLRARPMAPMHDADAGVIRFISRAQDFKDNEIEADHDVCLAYADTTNNTYVSITGVARVLRDREAVRAHWSEGADPWFEDGMNDPDAIIIEVTPSTGEYWDFSSSDVLVALRIAKAAAAGEEPRFGERAKVVL